MRLRNVLIKNIKKKTVFKTQRTSETNLFFSRKNVSYIIIILLKYERKMLHELVFLSNSGIDILCTVLRPKLSMKSVNTNFQ